MAGNNDLTFRIGIDNSDFDKGLKETQKKLTAAMAQFEREKSLIKIRADIDIAGLDETADKAKILDIQEKALTDTLDIQRQKLQAAANAYELVAESQGVQAAASKKIELAMEKERLKVVQLEKDLEKLKQSATGIDTTVKVNVDDSEIDNIKIDAPKVDIKADVDTSQVEKNISKAETAVKASVDKLSRQQALIQLRGQVQLEGLDEAAGSAEKLKLQEEALTAQIALQQEKISLLSNAYENLARSQGENSDAAQIAAINLEKNRLAMERLQQQTQDLSKQTEIAIGVEWELLGLIEPAIKGIDALIAAGHTIPIPHAKAAAAAAVALSAIVVGSKEATDELRENNPAQILSDSFEDADFDEVADNVSDSFAEISDSATQTSQGIETAFEESAEKVSEEMESFSGSYADYMDDALSIIQILTAETENLGDSLGVVNSQLPYMKTETGRIAAIALGVYKTFDEMTKAVIDFSQTAVDGFKEVRKQANELYLSLSKAQEISGLIDLAGGDYDDVRDYVRGVQDAVLKGSADDPEVLAMEKYGVVIQDTKGKLLEFDAALENLYQGYLKAAEAGEAEAYIIMTNGQSIHDVAGFLENYGKAKERAAQIKWSTSDFESLNELTTNLKMAEVQTNEFNNALSTLGAPLANLAAESNFEFFKQMTELIEENRDTILLWEFAAIEAFKSGKEAVIEFADSTIQELKELNEFFGVTDKLQSLIVGIGESVGLTAEFEETLTASDSDKDSIFDRAKKDLDAYNAANEKSREETKKSRSEAEGLSYSLNRIAKFKEEIADIKIELQFGDDNYKKSLAQLEQWRETALKDARRYEEEQKVIAEEYALKRQLIERQHQEELKKIREESLDRAKGFLQEAADIEYGSTHSAFEKQLYDIEQWKTAQLEKATTAEESAAIVTAALAKESAAIKAEAEDIQNNIKALTNETADIEFKNTHSAFEQQLRDLEKWKQAQLEKARTAEEVAAVISNAAIKETAAFENEMDRIKGKTQSLLEKIFEQSNSQRNIDIMRAQKQRQEYIDEGIYDPRLIAQWYQNELAKISNKGFKDKEYRRTPNLPYWQERNQNARDYMKLPEENFHDQIRQDVDSYTKQFEKLKPATDTSKIETLTSSAGQAAQALAEIPAPAQDLQQKISALADSIKDDFKPPETPETPNPNSNTYSNLKNAHFKPPEIQQPLLQQPNIDLAAFNVALQNVAGETLSRNFETFGVSLDSSSVALTEFTVSLQEAAEKIDGNSKDTTAADIPTVPQPKTANPAVPEILTPLADIKNKLDDFKNQIPVLKDIPPTPQGKMADFLFESFDSSITGTTAALDTFKNSLSSFFGEANAAEIPTKIPTKIPTEENQPPVNLPNVPELDFSPLQTAFNAFNSELNNAQLVISEFTLSLKDSADKINDLSFNAPQNDILSDITQIFSNSVFSQMTQELSTLSQTAGNIAQNVSAIQKQRQQPPQITVSPNISIDLGGAYVFDNQLKNQLTDDIASEVADAVKSAVETATTQASYGYGN